MNCPRKELLARTGFAQDKNRRTGRGDDLDLLQDPLESGAVAHNLLEVELGTHLILKIQLFLRQFVLQLGDLLIRQRVLYGNRHLLCHLAQQIYIVLSKRVLIASAHVQCPPHAIMGK